MSALRWFRKYEKLMLGVFGVLLMFVFTFSMGVSAIDPSNWFQGGGARQTQGNPVVAKWSEGDLLASDFQDLAISRNLMIQFSQAALAQARQRGGQPRVATVPLSNSEGSLLELAVLSKKAEDMGMKIDDQGVLNYLTQLTDSKLQPREFSNIWSNLVSERRTDKQLLNMMRRELMAIRVRGMMQSGNFPVSPIRYWEYYNRMERQISAEVMPLEVSQFVSQVAEPSEVELKNFFDKYKNQYNFAESPEPGFKQRQQAAFGYIKLDFEKFFEAELAAVTDEQVKEYYEKNKDDFQKMSFLDDDLGSGLDAPESSTATDESAGDATTAEGDASAEEASTTEKPAGDSAPPAKPEETEATAEEGTDPDSSPTPEPQDESTGETAGDAVTEKLQDAAGEVAEKAAEVVEKVEEAAKEAVEQAAEESTDATAEAKKEDLDASDLEVEAKPVTYKPLETVADEIKRTLARPIAQQKFAAAVSAARAKMEKYYRAHVMVKIKQSKGEEVTEPELPEVSGISASPQLRIVQLPLMDETEIADNELGQSFDIRFGRGGVEQVMFADVGFAQGVQPYRPEEFPSGDDIPGTKFLFWRTDYKEAYVPELDDVREQVVEAWKLQQAATLALAQAEKDAATANDQKDKSLADAISAANRTFFNTGEISWITGGNIPMDQTSRPQITQIDGVDSPGDELYEALFSAGVGETTAALNGPKTVAYVMKVTSQNPELDIRREGFFENVDKITGVPFLARVESRRDLGETYRDMLEASNVEWQRIPEGNQ